jgi:hypothetical protein
MMRVAVRLVVALFCWVTAIYAFLCSSAFAYQQFIRPRVFSWVGVFSDRHAVLYWAWLAVALLSIAGDFRHGGARRAMAVVFAAVWGAAGIWLTIDPVLPTLADSPRSLVVGLIALVPIVWLGVIDHVRSAAAIRGDFRSARTSSAPESTAAEGAAEARLFSALLGTAIVVPIIYAVLTPISLGGAFEPDLLTLGTTIGLLWNGADHLLLCAIAFLAAAIEGRLTARASFAARYAASLILVAFALGVAVQRLFADGIGLTGYAGAAVSALLSISIVATRAGLRIQRFAASDVRPVSGFDAIFGPPAPQRARWAGAARLGLIAAAAYALSAATARLDWDFMLAKLAVIGIWVAVFEQLYRTAPPRGAVGMRVMTAVCLAPLALHQADPALQRFLEARLNVPGLNVRHTLDRYLVYNPSFRLADGWVHGGATQAPRFDRFLRANTGLPGSASRPVDVDFVRPLQASPAGERPWIFLLVVDSLRADYLGAYNPDVTFTPAIDRFARESVVFRRAFTRYGGTGLSMPSIWMGAAGVHTQYLEPFRPMNALEKLLDANGYARYVSLDHIMAELLTPSPDLHELDRGVPEMALDFCGTLDELQGRVAAAPTPFFAHTRSLNLHVAAIRSSAIPRNEQYPGFEARYASRVRRMDGCFGRFVEFLKRRGIYDRSLIVLTADHGEELGADGRWGHAYYLFPGVLEVPLIVHLPRDVAAHASMDPGAIAFTTDITPTLYAALGYKPVRATPLMGEPLIGPPGADFSPRRRAREVVIASYGAVYGMLANNGRRLYIADGNHGVEYAYEREGRRWRETPVTPSLRAMGQRLIREYIEEIALEYHVSAF